MNRRGLLSAILAAAAAPAFVRSGSLMVPAPIKVAPIARRIVVSGRGVPILVEVGDSFAIPGIAGRFRVTDVATSGAIGCFWI